MAGLSLPHERHGSWQSAVTMVEVGAEHPALAAPGSPSSEVRIGDRRPLLAGEPPSENHAESSEEFSQRLRETAARNGVPLTATAFAHWFNRRSTLRPVTVHAARKWLVGEAIPRQARLLRLSAMLGVDPSWLRFGASPVGRTDAPREASLPGALLHAASRLSLRDQRLLLVLAQSMLDHPLPPATPGDAVQESETPRRSSDWW